MGLPVLVSDRGALSERIGKAGLTFRAEDAEDLARRLQGILDAPEVLEAMCRDIRPETLLSMEAHVARLEKIYEDAVRGNPPRLKASTPYLKLLAHAKQQIWERDAALSAVHADLARAEQAIQQKEADLQQVQRVVERLDAEARHYRESLEAILSSTFWKLTTPIRRLRHPIRTLLGRDRFDLDHKEHEHSRH